MNIYKVNLNLLKVFVVLMQKQHVSATAKCLHLTQSAISNTLQQLRELFNDELLIRGPKKMVPTQKALLIAPKITQVLNELETLLFQADEFDHTTSTRVFRLGMSDYAEYVLLPKLYGEIKKIAPRISLKILAHNEFSPHDFEHEKLELGIGLEKKLPKQLMMERIFSDSPVCVAHENHPIFKRTLTLDRYLKAEHLATCVYSDELSRADQALKKLDLKRHIKITMPHFLPAFQMLANSDLIGTFSKNVVLQEQKKYHLHHKPIPFSIPEFHIAQIWHRQQENDGGLLWLRALIRSICDKHF